MSLAEAIAPTLTSATTPAQRRPIGVFDSGVGGLSVLQALRKELPFEDFVYVSDNGFAPYGERDEAFVIERSQRITTYLTQHTATPIKALVIACNTATAAAIGLLRESHPALPIIGIEPALKPAAAHSRTQHIGVMATRGTLNSHKFQNLLASLPDQLHFVCQPCDGLAAAIEHAETPKINALCQEYTQALGQFGNQTGCIDTLVLGCTHYAFALAHLTALLPSGVHIISNGEPVARQTRRMLTALAPTDRAGKLALHSTGDCTLLTHAAQRWLGWNTVATPLSV